MTAENQTASLLRVLRGSTPADTLCTSDNDWGDLLQQARACGLIGRLGHRVAGADSAGSSARPAFVPPGPAAHFESARRLCRTQRAEIEREASFLRQALADLQAPVVVLKGAGYVLADLPAAAGRLFSDIDIMVPRASLARTESLLQQHGWLSTNANDYDQQYYRQWMHELPPMEHVHRHTVLDVHHTILPLTCRIQPDAAALFARAVPVAQHPGLFVLSPPDMVLHSMAHLFLNDELSHSLRDLTDIDALLRAFAELPGFWGELHDRASQHQLLRVLFYGLRYTRRLLNTPVPHAVMASLRAQGPGSLLLSLMDRLWLVALTPPAASALPLGTRLAELALYVRGHWMRMPPLMLARHLGIKLLRLHGKPEERQQQPTG